jgi:hypothetical protein
MLRQNVNGVGVCAAANNLHGAAILDSQCDGNISFAYAKLKMTGKLLIAL